MIDLYEIEELIADMAKDEDIDFEDIDDYDYYVYDTYGGISLESFTNIVEDLLKYTPLLKSPLTGKLSHCFGVIENPETGLFRAIIKKDYD